MECELIMKTECYIELLTALLEYLDLLIKVFCTPKVIFTIIVTNAGGENGTWVGDRKQGINKCWP